MIDSFSDIVLLWVDAFKSLCTPPAITSYLFISLIAFYVLKFFYSLLTCTFSIFSKS